MTWYFPRLGVYVPKFVSETIYPIDKTNLDVLRILHFLSLAVITVWFVPRDWPALKSRGLLAGDRLRPAFAGNLLPRRVSVVCRAISCSPRFPTAFRCRSLSASPASPSWLATAAMVSWYKRVGAARAGPRPPAAKPGLRGGRRMTGAVLALLALLVLARRRLRPSYPAECAVAAHLSSSTIFALAAGRRARSRQRNSTFWWSAPAHPVAGRERRQERLSGATASRRSASSCRASRSRCDRRQSRHAPPPRWLRRCRPISCQQTGTDGLADRHRRRDACRRSGSIQPGARPRHQACPFRRRAMSFWSMRNTARAPNR